MNRFIAEVAAQACGKWSFILDALAISRSKQHSPARLVAAKTAFVLMTVRAREHGFVISVNLDPVTVWIWLKMSGNVR